MDRLKGFWWWKTVIFQHQNSLSVCDILHRQDETDVLKLQKMN